MLNEVHLWGGSEPPPYIVQFKRIFMQGNDLKTFFNNHGFRVKDVFGDGSHRFMVYWNSKALLQVDRVSLDTFLSWLAESDRKLPSFHIKTLGIQNEMVAFFEKIYNFQVNEVRSGVNPPT